MTDYTDRHDDGLQRIVDAWPHLSERKRWAIYFLAVWYVFRTDVERLFNHLARAARAAVDTLKRK